jgi:hypothetical protein
MPLSSPRPKRSAPFVKARGHPRRDIEGGVYARWNSTVVEHTEELVGPPGIVVPRLF